MSGYRQWADGDVLRPQDIDEYLMGQAVMRFATAAARSAALPSPVEGMRSYLSDTKLEYIYANGVWAFMSAFIKKTINETVTSSTTIQDDDTFQLNLPVGTYRVELFLHYTGANGGDIKTQWAFAGVLATHSRSVLGLNLATSDVTSSTMQARGVFSTTPVAYGTDPAVGVAQEDLYLEVSTAGLLKLQWAQQASSATPTTVTAGSKLYATRLA